MKLIKKLPLLLVGLLIILSSCENSDDEMLTPKLPPVESVIINFNAFTGAHARPADEKFNLKTVEENYGYSRLVVGVWNTALITTLAVPVASFRTAFDHEPEFLGNQKWQWAYTVNGFSSQYKARLTGELASNKVIWEMYVEKIGVEGFDEFLWFSGISNLDGNSGSWMLNHSPEFQEEMLKIDWVIEGEEIGNIKYTYVRALNNDRQTDMFKDSYIVYGLQSGDFDAFYDVHAYDFDGEAFVDIDIEWSRTDFHGRVKAPQQFGDLWQCWDSTGNNDTNCPQ